MQTRPYEPFSFSFSFSFGHCANIDPIGLIKVNRRNYEALKNSANPQVCYNEKMDALMVDNNLVTIDDELADDVALYNPMFLPTSPPIRPIRPIELIRFLDIAP